MLVRTLLVTLCAAAVALASASTPSATPIRFTGRADVDFAQNKYSVAVRDGRGNRPDVGMSNDFMQDGLLAISGWDIRTLYFQYNAQQDELNIGIECFGVCGDADGDGFQGSASATLRSLGGKDNADLAGSEGVAVALDFNMDVANVFPSGNSNVVAPFDFIIGVPASQPPSGPRLPCTQGIAESSAEYLNQARCFGLYEYARTNQFLGGRFARPALLSNGQPWPVVNRNPNVNVNVPHWEWTIQQVSALRAKVGENFARSPQEPWMMLIQAWAGSLDDASIGEDYVPALTDYEAVNFPCQNVDACDVCLGDGSTCRDCAGVANGPSKYDACGVCGGDGKSCSDCRGVPNGKARYDSCGVCNGDNSKCADCAGTPNGKVAYDECDVCGGDGTSCVDCLGVPNGAARYDRCDVCAGDSTTCLDCKGLPNGPNVYDSCGVCGGDDSKCVDCKGVPNGKAQYDACGVCEGNADTCLDCMGVPNGSAAYDECHVCEGDNSACADCAGFPHGSHEYDACDVCNGDSTTCLDCHGVPFGTAAPDECGVCGGDGSTCVCAAISHVPLAEVDHALLEWSLVATSNRITHTIDVLEGVRDELTHYDVQRGALAEALAAYLDTSNDFLQVLESFVYVHEVFKQTVDETNQLA